MGGNVYGKFPLMTNYSSFNASNDDYADTRGLMLPGISLAQYGATLAKWFGAADADLDALFPTIPALPTRDLGFMSECKAEISCARVTLARVRKAMRSSEAEQRIQLSAQRITHVSAYRRTGIRDRSRLLRAPWESIHSSTGDSRS